MSFHRPTIRHPVLGISDVPYAPVLLSLHPVFRSQFFASPSRFGPFFYFLLLLDVQGAHFAIAGRAVPPLMTGKIRIGMGSFAAWFISTVLVVGLDDVCRYRTLSRLNVRIDDFIFDESSAIGTSISSMAAEVPPNLAFFRRPPK